MWLGRVAYHGEAQVGQPGLHFVLLIQLFDSGKESPQPCALVPCIFVSRSNVGYKVLEKPASVGIQAL